MLRSFARALRCTLSPYKKRAKNCQLCSNYLQTITLFVPFKLENRESLLRLFYPRRVCLIKNHVLLALVMQARFPSYNIKRGTFISYSVSCVDVTMLTNLDAIFYLPCDSSLLGQVKPFFYPRLMHVQTITSTNSNNFLFSRFILSVQFS